jgi:hypothetical protein
MAQKGENDNLKDRAQAAPRKRQKREPQGSVDCGHSTGILPYLLEPPKGSSVQRPMAKDRLAKLRRAFKKEFGYKPTGKTVAELEDVIRSRSISKYGDAEHIFEHM